MEIRKISNEIPESFSHDFINVVLRSVNAVERFSSPPGNDFIIASKKTGS